MIARRSFAYYSTICRASSSRDGLGSFASVSFDWSRLAIKPKSIRRGTFP
jgi:hypothetical protein